MCTGFVNQGHIKFIGSVGRDRVRIKKINKSISWEISESIIFPQIALRQIHFNKKTVKESFVFPRLYVDTINVQKKNFINQKNLNQGGDSNCL